MFKKQLFAVLTLVLSIVAMVVVPVSASAQYYYDNYGYQPSYYYPPQNYYYPPQGYYSAPRSYYNGYSQPYYPSYNYNYNYNNNLGYSPYAYNVRYSNRETRTSSEEMKYLYDLEGNRIGSYKKSGSYYKPYFGNYTYSATSSSSSSSSSSTTKKTKTVYMDNDEYDPSSITIKRGDTVKWVNEDHHYNTVTGDSTFYNIDSDKLDYNDTYSKTFNTVGTFKYHSRYNTGMRGTVTVTN